ncbi:MAG TPA: hypothetical protein VGD22_14030 [Sphingobacteriaceae bacterium]
MKILVNKYLVVPIAFLLISLNSFAQNVVDSDLSNNAGTNKNFSGEWWLFGVLGLVVLVFLVAYGRQRRKRI